jgi:hypothetical protein
MTHPNMQASRRRDSNAYRTPGRQVPLKPIQDRHRIHFPDGVEGDDLEEDASSERYRRHPQQHRMGVCAGGVCSHRRVCRSCWIDRTRGLPDLSQADIYRVNLIFPLKMYALAAAFIYNFTVHRKVATMENPPPVLSKIVAMVSLLLWVAVVFGGIFTGFLV